MTSTEMIGKKYGRLTVLAYVYSKPDIGSFYKCKCDCGNYTIKSKTVLVCGRVRSCGCLAKENQEAFAKRATKHGKRYTRTYRIWNGMLARCRNPKHKHYKYYGGRGIQVNANWLSFPNFLKDMGECPEGLSIDRIDNNSGYYKENCRWATNKQQHNNTSTCVYITFQEETHTIKEWANIKNINYNTLKGRITRSKWPIDKALSTPVT